MYLRHMVHLTKHQLEKIRAAARKREAVSVLIDPRIRGNVHLYLTETQINRLNKGSPVRVTLSRTQLEKNGGFIITIPTLLAGIGAAAGIASAAATTAKAVLQKKHDTKVEKETQRHNHVVEDFLKKQGKGAFLPKRQGRGVYLPKRL